MTIGDKIKKAREAKELSQKALWSEFISFYNKAYAIALKNNKNSKVLTENK